MRKQLVHGKKILLFIDTGDNCRCPLAVGYLRKLLREKNIDYIDIRHAGVMCPNDLLPTPEVVHLLQEEGEDIKKHRSRPLTLDLIQQADLILGMTPIHVQKCIRWTEEAKGKTFLLKEYVGYPGKNVQIPDPMGGTMEIFKKCFTDMRQALHKLVEMDFITQPAEPEEVTIVTGALISRQIKPEDMPENAVKADENSAELAEADQAKPDKASTKSEKDEEKPKSAAKAKPAKKSAAKAEAADEDATKEEASPKKKTPKKKEGDEQAETKPAKAKGKVSAKKAEAESVEDSAE